MGAVLGISLSATRAGLVVVDDVGADAETVMRDRVAVPASGSATGMESVAAAVLQVARTAAELGHPVTTVGLTCLADAEQRGLALATLLADSDLAEVEVFELTAAAAALAEAVGVSKRSRRIAVMVIAEDQTIAVLVDGRDATRRTSVTAHRDDDARLTSLGELIADWRPGLAFAMVSRTLAAEGFSARLEAALTPQRLVLADADLALARGVAIAAGNAFAEGDSGLAVPDRRQPSGLHRGDWLLVAAVAVTLLVAVMMVVQARGSIRADIAGNAPVHRAQVVAPSHAAAAPPVLAAERADLPVADFGDMQIPTLAEPLAAPASAPAVVPAAASPTPPAADEPAPSPIQDAIAQVEQLLGIDVDNDGVIGNRAE